MPSANCSNGRTHTLGLSEDSKCEDDVFPILPRNGDPEPSEHRPKTMDFNNDVHVALLDKLAAEN